MLRELTEVNSKDRMAEVSKRWKDLTDDQRADYNAKAQKTIEDYEVKWQAYVGM